MITMKKSVIILSISVYATEVNGFRGAIITKSTAENESGVWKKTTKQLERFAQQVGASDLATLARHVKDATFSYEATPVKAGEEWENPTDGSTGKYTKDHVRINNETIELSQANNMMLSAASMIAKNIMASFSAPVATTTVSPEVELELEGSELDADKSNK